MHADKTQSFLNSITETRFKIVIDLICFFFTVNLNKDRVVFIHNCVTKLTGQSQNGLSLNIKVQDFRISGTVYYSTCQSD